MSKEELHSEVQDIKGIGEVKADQILELVDEHIEAETSVPEELENDIREMNDYYESSQKGYAGNYLNNIMEHIDG